MLAFDINGAVFYNAWKFIVAFFVYLHYLTRVIRALNFQLIYFYLRNTHFASIYCGAESTARFQCVLSFDDAFIFILCQLNGVLKFIAHIVKTVKIKIYFLTIC